MSYLQIQTTLTEVFGNEAPVITEISDINNTEISTKVIQFARKKRDYPREKISKLLTWLKGFN